MSMWQPIFSALTAVTSRGARRKKGLNAISAAAATGRGKSMRPRRSRMKKKALVFSSTRKRTEKWKNMR